MQAKRRVGLIKLSSFFALSGQVNSLSWAFSPQIGNLIFNPRRCHWA